MAKWPFTQRIMWCMRCSGTWAQHKTADDADWMPVACPRCTELAEMQLRMAELTGTETGDR